MIALHGFLGSPEDWHSVFSESEQTHLIAPAWMKELACLPTGETMPGLPMLATHLNREALLSGRTRDALIGYSMGGRIALHMLLDSAAPKLWNCAVIVSASPGLADPEERSRRWYQDRSWAERFRIEEWGRLMDAWNGQSVFSHDSEPPRFECNYDRSVLAEALLRGSVASQENLRAELASLNIPILWVAGELDSKYASLARECAALNPLFECRIVCGSGHRAPWAQPEAFRNLVSDFVKKVCEV